VLDRLIPASAEPRPGYACPMDPLFGRRDELSRLRTALERAERGQGSLLVLTGEAGIGKSRLARELDAIARERKVVCPGVAAGRPAGHLLFGPGPRSSEHSAPIRSDS
jgi:hypothetical protein